MELVSHNNTTFNVCHFQGRSFFAYTYIIERMKDREVCLTDKIDIITFFNNKDNAILPIQLEKNDIPYINGFTGIDKKWDNRNKIEYTINALDKCKNDVVMICDANDVLIYSFDCLLDKFKNTRKRILFNATTNNFPDILIDKVRDRDFYGRFRYFNAGCCIGYKKDLLAFYKNCKEYLEKNPYNPWNSEQFILRNVFGNYLENNNNTIGYDYKCNIFQTFANTKIEKDGDKYRVL